MGGAPPAAAATAKAQARPGLEGGVSPAPSPTATAAAPAPRRTKAARRPRPATGRPGFGDNQRVPAF